MDNKKALLLLGGGTVVILGFGIWRLSKTTKFKERVEAYREILFPNEVLEEVLEVDRDVREYFNNEEVKRQTHAEMSHESAELTGEDLETDKVDYTAYGDLDLEAAKKVIAKGATLNVDMPGHVRVAEEVAQEMRDSVEEPHSIFDLEEEDVTKLRQGIDPSSIDALEQYHSMLLADIEPGRESRAVIRNLFNYTMQVEMGDVKDETVEQHIMEQREDFFGRGSKWNNTATIGELIIHFATKLQFDLGEDIQYWAEEILANTALDTPGLGNREVNDIVDHIQKHSLTIQQADGSVTFGLFALPTVMYIHNADGTVDEEPITNSDSFTDQFNMFLVSMTQD